MEGDDEFAGPLYPPDAKAKGKTPSKDSPLVTACKRFAAHLGAWPWDPEGWDDSYSNSFSHGKPGDPTRAGMAAIQRWSGTLDDTGWFGTKSYNFARSVLIPQGRTHAGEPAWDQVCVQLAAQAWEMQKPPPPPEATMTVREAALARAISKLGVKESPANTNQQEFGKWYGEDGVAWCAIFDSWSYVHGAADVGKNCASFQTVKQAGGNDRHDFVPYVVSDARNGRYGFSVVSPAYVKPGDIVAYNWGGSASASEWEFDHVGLFERWEDGNTVFSAIEGNTSLNNNSNGGEVMRRSRNVNSQGTVFIRVAES